MDAKKNNFRVEITEDGPYRVIGKIPLSKEHIITDNEGYPTGYKFGQKFEISNEYLLCRCGKSKNKPFCDYTHVKIKFKGKETASTKSFKEESEKIKGSDLILYDNIKLCSGAGFCNGREGNIWDLTVDSKNPKSRKLAINQGCLCTSGRLVTQDPKTKKENELKFNKSITLIEEDYKKISGPIWLKGGINLVSSNGVEYETRNRITLCRCGKSKNKPFCDSTHRAINFNLKSD